MAIGRDEENINFINSFLYGEDRIGCVRFSTARGCGNGGRSHIRRLRQQRKFDCGYHHEKKHPSYVLHARPVLVFSAKSRPCSFPFIRSEERRVGKECKSRW